MEEDIQTNKDRKIRRPLKGESKTKNYQQLLTELEKCRAAFTPKYLLIVHGRFRIDKRSLKIHNPSASLSMVKPEDSQSSLGKFSKPPTVARHRKSLNRFVTTNIDSWRYLTEREGNMDICCRFVSKKTTDICRMRSLISVTSSTEKILLRSTQLQVLSVTKAN
ncbi:hypothetical protein PoB_004492400 [Plakobranchus ocellatus]|uniref:Uncharacterized protein n=1 Tax=Plakobranchus ocellatus TaxID=259542 RepID=A0AAV4BJD6_9GAST|nr:hypothetical protein PoB_004492400 [Plakobranchus ocellatus]